MANLLPLEHKQGIVTEYQLRLAVGGLGLLAIVLVAGIALLVPSFILTEDRHQQYESTLNSANKTTVSTSTKQNKQIVQRTNQKLDLVKGEQQSQIQPTEILQLLAETQTEGVDINNISLDPEFMEEEGSTVSVSGVADTRDDLLAFEDNLNSRAQVTSTDLPIETLASRQQTEFDMTITVKPL